MQKNKNRYLLIGILLLLFIIVNLTCIIYICPIFTYTIFRFLEIDNCLDVGGRYDYGLQRCIYPKEHKCIEEGHMYDWIYNICIKEVKVRYLVYSGRSDPEWTVDLEKDLGLERISKIENLPEISKPSQIEFGSYLIFIKDYDNKIISTIRVYKGTIEFRYQNNLIGIYKDTLNLEDKLNEITNRDFLD